MRYVQIILGPPGTGKTTTLLKIVEDALSRGVSEYVVIEAALFNRICTALEKKGGEDD